MNMFPSAAEFGYRTTELCLAWLHKVQESISTPGLWPGTLCLGHRSWSDQWEFPFSIRISWIYRNNYFIDNHQVKSQANTQSTFCTVVRSNLLNGQNSKTASIERSSAKISTSPRGPAQRHSESCKADALWGLRSLLLAGQRWMPSFSKLQFCGESLRLTYSCWLPWERLSGFSGICDTDVKVLAVL